MFFSLYVESRDRDNLRRLGLSGMQIRRFPHKNYNVKKADRAANADFNEKRRKEAESTEAAVRERLYQHFSGHYARGHTYEDHHLLSRWRDRIEHMDVPFEINWNAPDPRQLLVICDYLEDRGVDVEELRNYAQEVWGKVKVDQRHISYSPRRNMSNKPDFEDIDDRIDHPDRS